MERMTKTDPSDKQLEVLKFIENFIDRNGYSPSLHEIAEAMGWASDSTAYDSLQGLVRLGYIKRQKGKSRSITIIKRG